MTGPTEPEPTEPRAAGMTGAAGLDPAVRALVERLGLQPHPEGGWYRETWRAAAVVRPPGYAGPRAAGTAIQFLLPAGEVSRWHRVASDELWLWQGLGPLLLRHGGTAAAPAQDAATGVLVGPDPAAGHLLQALVPAGTWQSAAPTGPAGTLVACVVAPGFDFADFELDG
jgi:predicted cupin superfamily sugar epimerase